jgi:hypothetical protein
MRARLLIALVAVMQEAARRVIAPLRNYHRDKTNAQSADNTSEKVLLSEGQISQITLAWTKLDKDKWAASSFLSRKPVLQAFVD